MQPLKQSTAFTTIVGPILDSTGASYASAVIGDLNITKNGTTAAMAAAATLTHDHNGHYILVGTTGNSDTLGRLDITCNKATYAMPPKSFEVLAQPAFDTLVTNGTLASTTSGRTIATSAAGIVDANLAQALGAAVTCTTAGVPLVDVSRINNVSTSAVTTIKAVQGIAVDGVITTVTNQLTTAQIATGVWQDAVAGDFTTASSIGKALYVSNVAPGGSGGIAIVGSAMTLAANQHVIVDSGTVTTVTNQLTAAQIATGIWTDTTAGDFTVSLSAGKSIFTGVAPGAASGISIVGSAMTLTSAYDAAKTAGTSTLTQTQVTGGAYSIQSASCVLGDARIANLDATVSSRGTSTLTQTQVTGGSYSVQSASCVLGDTRIAYLDVATSSRLASASYTTPPTVAAIRAEIDTNSTQLAKLGVPTNADLATDIADIPALLLQYPLAPGAQENGSVGQALAAPFTEKFASATTTTVTFRTLFSSTVDDAYKDSIIQLTSGAGEGQWRYITAYVGSTHTATLNRAWDVTPAANDQFILRPATRASISPTASENADALLARTDGIETGVTPKQALRAAMALAAGKVSGAGTGTEVFYAPDGSTARMTFTVDSSGNRTVSVNL